MANENSSQTQHITKLDFDISAIQGQLNQIESMLKRTSGNLANVNLGNNFNNQLKDTKKQVDQLNAATKNLWTSNSKNYSLFQNMENDKKKLESIINQLGVISKLKYQVNSAGVLKGAQVSYTDKQGKSMVQSFQLQRKLLGELADGTKLYENSWINANTTIINNIEGQRKATERLAQQQQKQQAQLAREQERQAASYQKIFDIQERQANSYVNRLNTMIEKQKDFQAQQKLAVSPNAGLIRQSADIQKQLELMQQRISASKAVSESDQRTTQVLQAQTREISRQAAASNQQANSQQKLSAMQERQANSYINQLNTMIEKQKNFQSQQMRAVVPNTGLIQQSTDIQKQLELMQQRIAASKVVSETDLKAVQSLQAQTNELKRQAAMVNQQAAAQQRLLAMQERQASSYINRLNTMIEKQKVFQAQQKQAVFPNKSLLQQSTDIQKQLELMQQRIAASKAVSQADRQSLQVLQAQTNELKRQAAASRGMFTGMDSRGMIRFLSQVTGFYGGVYLLNRGLRELISTMSEVETRVMEISRIAADANFDKTMFTGQLFDISKNYGRNFDQASDSVLRFVQAGYSVEESLSLAQKSMLALNTAELDATQATQSLISIMKQWDLETSDYEGLVDRINKTADSFAITSEDLVNGLAKSSSVAKLANIDFENTLGLLTAMKVTSGASGKEVGNALKSILSYIQRPSSLSTFEGLGIDVYADKMTGELLPMMDILSSMVDRWNNVGEAGKDAFLKQIESAVPFNEDLALLVGAEEDYENALQKTEEATTTNDEATRKLATAAAGVYRKNYFTALMDNFSMVQEVVANLNDVEGYSLQENSRYMETLNARYETFIATLKELAVASGQSGLREIAVILLEIGTALASMMNAGTLTIPVMTALGTTLFSVFKKGSPIMAQLAVDFGLTRVAMQGQTASTQALIAAQGVYQSAALKTIATNAAMTLGISALVVMLIKAVSAIREESEFLNKAQNNYDQRMKSIIENAEAQKADMEVIQTYIQILQESMDAEGQSNLSKEMALGYIKEINEALGENTVKYNENTGNIVLNTEAIEEAIASEERRIEAKFQQDELEERIKQKVTLTTQMEQKRLEIAQLESKVRENMANMRMQPSDIDSANLDKAKSQLSNLERQYDEVAASLEGYIEKVNNFNKSNATITNSLDENVAALDTMRVATDEAVAKVETFMGALENTQNGVAYTADEINYLTGLYPELTDAVYLASDGFHFEEDALVALSETAAAEANARIRDEQLKADASAKNTQARIDNIKAEIMALQALMSALNVAYGVMAISSPAPGLALGLGTSMKAPQEAINKATEQLNQQSAALAKSQQGLNAANAALGKLNSLGVRGGSGGGTASGVKKGGGGGGGGGGSKGSGSGGSGSSKSQKEETPYWEIEIDEFEFLRHLGRKTTEEIVAFYREIANIAELSVEDRRKYELKLFDEINNQIDESLKIYLEAENKKLEALKQTADNAKTANSDLFSNLKNYRDTLYAQYEQEASEAIERINKDKQAQLDAIDAVEKEKDKARQKEEYERNRRKILEDIASASVRSGVQYRKAEKEGLERLADLDRQWEETQSKWNIEEQKRQIEELKNKEIEAVNEMMEKNKAFVDAQVKNLLGTIAYIFDSAKNANGEYTEESIKAISSQLETMSSLISGMGDKYITAAKDPIDEMEKILTEKLNTITDSQVTNLEKNIAAVEEEFSEKNRNMISDSSTYSADMYNEYLQGFILPMANGTYEGFTLANENMVKDAFSYANKLNEIYATISPPKFEISPDYVPQKATLNPELANGLSEMSGNKTPISTSIYNNTNNTSNPNNSSNIVVNGNLLNMNNTVKNKLDEMGLAGKVISKLANGLKLLP